MNRHLISHFNKLTLLAAAILLVHSCEVPEGEGGNSSIQGVLYTKSYNEDFSEHVHTKEAVDRDVFIVYGDEDFIGDKTETMFDGSFKFSNLRPGDYTVYYYSDDTLNTENQENIPIFVRTEITEKKEELDLGKLYRYKKLKWNDGDVVIRGEVRQINYYDATSWPNLIVKDTSDAQEFDVYLTYNEHEFYDERIKTHHDGTFEFNSLIPGNYDIFMYSEDVRGGTEDIVIHQYVEINSTDSIINLGTIYVENK